LLVLYLLQKLLSLVRNHYLISIDFIVYYLLAVTVYRDPPKAVLIETGGRLLLTCKRLFEFFN
jgi:hypothetical protein